MPLDASDFSAMVGFSKRVTSLCLPSHAEAYRLYKLTRDRSPGSALAAYMAVNLYRFGAIPRNRREKRITQLIKGANWEVTKWGYENKKQLVTI